MEITKERPSNQGSTSKVSCHERMVLIACADNEDPDQTAHMRSLIRVFAVHRGLSAISVQKFPSKMGSVYFKRKEFASKGVGGGGGGGGGVDPV